MKKKHISSEFFSTSQKIFLIKNSVLSMNCNFSLLDSNLPSYGLEKSTKLSVLNTGCDNPVDSFTLSISLKSKESFTLLIQ